MIPPITLAEVSLPTIDIAAATIPYYTVHRQWGNPSQDIDDSGLVSCFPYVLDMILV